MFALKCEHIRFHSLTEMAQDRIGQTKKSATRGHKFYVIQLQKWHVD